MNAPINHQSLEEHLQNLARAQGSPSKVTVTPLREGGSLQARINLVNYDINLEIPQGWDPAQYARIKRFAQKLQIKDTLRKVCDDVTLHEVGHNKLRNDEHGLGVPGDVQGKEITIDAVSKAMREAGRFSIGGVLYLENVIADAINNLNCSNYSKFNGANMFFAEQGEVNGGKYSPLFEAFVKLNMGMWGSSRQRKLVKHYYTDKKEIDEVVKSCIEEVGITKDKKHNLALLFNRSQWHDTFYTFAKHLVELMDQNAPEILFGSGNGGKGYVVPAEFDDGEGAGAFDPEKIDDPLLKRVLDKDNMKKVMQRRNQNGEDVPTFVENWRALDYFYQGLASELFIKAETPKKGQRMPIAPIQTRQFDPDRDSLDHILFGKIVLDESGKPAFTVPRGYVEHTARYKSSITNYTELNIAVLDNSGSMQEAANAKGVGRQNIVPWGDNSKYHYALLAYYGVEKALHRMGVGTKTRYNLVTFSSRTEATGEKSYEDRTAIKRRILEPVFGDSTSIDTGILARSAHEPGSVLMTISDGDIQNWDSVKNDFKRIIADKFYVHFQIGSDTQTTRDLESWGATVVKISDAAEMPKKAIDITKRFYQSYMAGEVR